MKFLELLTQLEKRLGYHQFPINANATEIHEIFESSPVHGQLAIRLARKIYKSNNCKTVNDDITDANTNNALVAIRLEILRAQQTDIDVFTFMHELCHTIKDLIADSENRLHEDAPRPIDTGNTQTAQIITLENYRRRIKSWA